MIRDKLFLAGLCLTMLGACATGASTNTGRAGADVAGRTIVGDGLISRSTVDALVADVARLRPEVEAVGSPRLLEAWTGIERSMVRLAVAAEGGALNEVLVKDARDAVNMMGAVIQAEGDAVGFSLHNAWSDFRVLFNAALP